MFKNNFELIAEACKAEKCETTSLECDMTKSAFKSVFDDMETMDIELGFTPAMVPVVQSRFTEECYVDMTDVIRLAEANNATLDQAYYAIVSENNIDPSRLFVVVESGDEVLDMINEAKKDPKKLNIIQKAIEKMDQMKRKAIPMKKKQCKDKAKCKK